MDELKFEKRESDYLILTSKSGEEFRVEIDDSLKQAIRKPEIHGSNFSPAEIQKLIRSGLSLEAVASQLGLSASQVEPFAAPVIAEIEYIKQNALDVRLAANEFDYMIRLEDLLREKWGNTVEFLLKKADHEWLLEAKSNGQLASWSYDPRTNQLKAIDDAARELAEESQAAPVFEVISNQPEPEPEERPLSVATDLLEELQRRRAARATEEPEPAEPKKGRPSVPSWDEIVFGTNSDSEKD